MSLFYFVIETGLSPKPILINNYVMKAKILKIILCVTLVFNSGCIHTKSLEAKSLDISQSEELAAVINTDSLVIKNTIYSEEKYPLEDFFSRLKKGEFIESFKKIDVRYKPSNTKNEIVRKLLEEGLVPVMISIKNNGTEPKMISYKQFYLTDGKNIFTPLAPETIPSEVKQFSPESLAANVYNFAVVVTAVVAVIFALALISGGKGGGMPSSGFGSSSSKSSGSPLFNDTTFTTRIYYSDYLINDKRLEPGQETYGLVFFLKREIHEAEEFKLGFK